jgi:glycosyltransferase involved in cell wall biosynthesis
MAMEVAQQIVRNVESSGRECDIIPCNVGNPRRARTSLLDVRVLFIHQNFPAQFCHVAPALAAAGHEVHALSFQPHTPPPHVTNHTYVVARTSTKGIHPWVIDFETKTIRAEACARKMVEMRSAGFTPDIVIGHPGWGETWLVKDVWPRSPLLLFQEFYYGADMNFDPEFAGRDLEGTWRTRLKNANILVGLETMDWGLSPTHWQRAQFPSRYRERISVVFDGIDTDYFCPDSAAAISIGSPPIALKRGDEVVTFISRNLEPYRGYHSFMRSLPMLFERRPNARVIIVGGDGRGYGAVPARGTWREKFFREVRDRINEERVHFLGYVPHEMLLSLYRIAACHVYLTYPFVLSWSMLECMSTGGLVIGSRTPPVEEVIHDGENGLLVDFFDPAAIAAQVEKVLAEPSRFATLREAARRTIVERYALRTQCLPKQLALIDTVAKDQVSTMP